MSLYQADILDEEVVRQWGTHVSKKYVDKEKSKKVRKSAAMFLEVGFGFGFISFSGRGVPSGVLMVAVARPGRGV
jgi:hypothetical protein